MGPRPEFLRCIHCKVKKMDKQFGTGIESSATVQKACHLAASCTLATFVRYRRVLEELQGFGEKPQLILVEWRYTCSPRSLQVDTIVVKTVLVLLACWRSFLVQLMAPLLHAVSGWFRLWSRVSVFRKLIFGRSPHSASQHFLP